MRLIPLEGRRLVLNIKEILTSLSQVLEYNLFKRALSRLKGDHSRQSFHQYIL